MAVISLELNELNLHYVRKFVTAGKLPGFAKLLKEKQLFETVSELGYPYLEPWIQWPTVYNGKTYNEHKIFRLGDSVYKPQPQIWEKLEAQGVKVGALSPMNAANACANPDFFMPDPWTNTEVTASPRATRLYALIRDVVNDNASSELSSFKLGRQLLPLALPYLRGKSLARYLRILPMALRHKWAKAAFLDCLLTDLFLSLMDDNGTQYGSLFLNAGAHIQHHHMFDSEAYEGERRNPGWYSSAAESDVDPLLFIYSVYEDILNQFLETGNRVLITTGLSQMPNEREHYQYRIVDFDSFFAEAGLKDAEIKPRMSRDFLLDFPTREAAEVGIATLDTVRCGDKPLFSIEDRGTTLFCQVGYFGAPEGLDNVTIGSVSGNHRAKFTLVSIENGIHQTIGYHIDSAIAATGETQNIPLTEVHERLYRAAIDATASRPKVLKNVA
ncbi:hypothetical protein [Novosphingobium naphthalenivorans]|uniref:hypothetical protein n=1 Tax=Novosphingobium naphthalenivorans TaxID=273168 RepID=UPI00082A48DB|nr:hypothetical protein [Novosphingobium naphthalenivorans]